MQQKTVVHERPGESLSVTVSEATVLQGMKRATLISEAVALLRTGRPEAEDEPEAEDLSSDWPEGERLSLHLVRRYTWPTCIACTTASTGFDHVSLTFDEFCLLSERFVAEWEKAALELNPHWSLRFQEDEDEEAEEKKDEDASESD